MTATHTSGPWHALRQGVHIKSETGDHEVMASPGGVLVNICSLFSGHFSESIPDGEDPSYEISSEEAFANARLIAAAPDGLKAAEMAYLCLLQLPHGRLRLNNQETLCALRDFIASATDREPEHVQNEFEARAIAKAEGKKV